MVPLKQGTSVVLLLVALDCLDLTGILTSMQGKQNDDNLRSEVTLNLIHTQDGCTITKLNGHNLHTTRSSLSNTSSFGRQSGLNWLISIYERERFTVQLY